MSRLSIKTLLLGAMTLLLLVSSIQGIVGFVSVRSLVAQEDKIAKDWLPSVKVLSDVRYDMMLYRLRVNRLLTVKDEQKEGVLKTVQDAQASLNKDLDLYKTLISTPEEERLFKDFQTSWPQYLAAEKDAIALVMKGDREQAAAVLNEKALPFAQKAQASLQSAVEINTKGADAAVDAGQAAANVSEGVNLAMLALGFLVGIAAMMIVRSRVVAPMGHITVAMEKLAAGDLALTIPHADRHDEIGAMAGAVQVDQVIIN